MSAPLSPSEWLVLSALHASREPARLASVCAAVGKRRPLPESTIEILLQRLHQRGLLLHDSARGLWGPLVVDFPQLVRERTEDFLKEVLGDDPRLWDIARECFVRADSCPGDTSGGDLGGTTGLR